MGLNTIRAIFIKEKLYQQHYKGVIESINAMTASTTNQEPIMDIVRMFHDLPSYIHTINILRWYGMYRNHGTYNTDLYFSVYGKIQNIIEEQARLLKKGQAMMPAKETL